jgi:hypothetical protein
MTMTTATTTGISLSHLHLVWPDLWPLLEPATLLAPEKPDVLGRLLSQHAQLWAVYEDGKPLAAIVTEITLMPEKRCRIWLVGGTRMREWAGDFLAMIEHWARAYGCAALWGTQSRAGWLRIVRKFGGEEAGIINGQLTWERRIA